MENRERYWILQIILIFSAHTFDPGLKPLEMSVSFSGLAVGIRNIQNINAELIQMVLDL